MKTRDEYEAAAMLLNMAYDETTRSFWKRCAFGAEIHYDRDTMARLSSDEALDRAGFHWDMRLEDLVLE